MTASDLFAEPVPLDEPIPEQDGDLLAFTPVPLAGRAKWTPKVQRAFIDALSQCGVVCVAAQAVGCTAQSANRLRRLPGSESFAAAWDWAIEMGLDEQRSLALQRIKGEIERPLVKKGEVVGSVTEPHWKLMFAALGALAPDREWKRSRLPHRRRIASRERKRRWKLYVRRLFHYVFSGGKSGKRRRHA